MAYSDNFPATRPVFMADFANGGKIDPRATFSRASTGTFFGTDKHESSQNLVEYSSDISNSYWTKQGVSPTGGQTAPDGGTDAYKLTEDAATSDHRIYHTFGATPTDATTITFFVKYIGRQWIYVRAKDVGGTNRYCWFDIQNGTKGTEQANITATISASGNGYYKCTVVLASAIASGQSLNIGGAAADGDGAGFAGLNGDAFSIWGINMSTLGETVLNETSGSVHRSYAPTLQTAASGAARFEHSTDGQSMGVLLESQSTNLFLRSESIGSSSWTKFRSNRDGDVAVAPDGTLTADKLRDDTSANATHGIYQNFTASSATAYTVSVYAKADGRSHFAITFDDYGSIFANDSAFFNLSTGATGTTDSDITSSIQDCGGGWFRCIATRTTLTSGSARVAFYLADADNSTSYTGNKYSGVLLWGAMAEASSHCSSYLKTEASTVTRAADSLSVATADIGYTGGDATVFVESTGSSGGDYPCLIGLDDGGSADCMRVFRNSGSATSTTDFQFNVNDSSGSNQVASLVSGSGAGNKFAMRLAENNAAFAFDGNTPTTDTSCVMPVTTTLKIGSGVGVSQINGTIKRVALYSEALSDQNLISLTS